ncbi:benzoyl-CoA-dihydrodiol lyase [[Actinomadura] parvosata subsp. kistnae]|uniref:Benzoyl-CoA-dihydrodiol lyase n=1 Tax=[Actinomadura] parvosata subsp. kistnae TaxID=1909395 RepID=A0A1V0A2B6_9ACTN|nr:2,3-epoxybenzoyl-CoA dihydrolase [Nonomuraea sp. ATCC 55076]AQZ64309.1 benzoyl-CoA-dihydrodiol lyase [Nonomuraea sp. ATCC 55076]
MTGQPEVSFDTDPGRYRHLRLEIDGEIAWIVLEVDEGAGIVPGYDLKLNSYDLGVDIELHDAVQRLRFEHPEVGAVVVTGAPGGVFCAGANIRMLARSDHSWKVNFCKFTNETRNAIEDATAHSGQTYLAAINGTAAGGGYELALACERIILVDDGSTTVSLPEVPLLGVLPGTGGLTRLTDKRGVRKDLADVFATRSEGVRGRVAVEWGLVDEVVPRSRFEEVVRVRAREAAARSRPARPAGAEPVPLPPVRSEGYVYGTVAAEPGEHAVAITVRGPEAGDEGWFLRMTRELDDLILRLRTNEPELGTWVIRTAGDIDAVLAHEPRAGVWPDEEVRHFYKRTLKRLDVTSRSLIALIEPGSCFAGPLLELALACDRQYMLDDPGRPVAIQLSRANFGDHPMGNGLSRLAARFHAEPGRVAKLEQEAGRRIGAGEALELGLVTFAPDDLDWDDEVRLALEERAALSPDALTGLEANLRFAGPETMETKIFARLAAWQNWIFTRPGAAGPEGALRRYGTGRRPVYDRKRA